MRFASIEVLPREILSSGYTVSRHMKAGTRVYIARLIGRPFNETLETARRLRADGMIPVPHIAARSIASLDELKSRLGALRESGVTEALVVGGAEDRPVGMFDSAGQLLRTGQFDGFGFSRIGVAGYPEGAPQIPDQRLRSALAEKVEFAWNSDIEMYIVTQFCFGTDEITNWVRDIQSVTMGRLNIHIGVPGLTTVASLMRYAAICGVGQSVRYLRNNAARLSRLGNKWSPDDLILGICESAGLETSTSIAQFHFFPFGSLERTSIWIAALQNSDRGSGRAICGERTSSGATDVE
jgi:methylenetetrahydrofolate reductase (NADH)